MNFSENILKSRAFSPPLPVTAQLPVPWACVCRCAWLWVNTLTLMLGLLLTWGFLLTHCSHGGGGVWGGCPIHVPSRSVYTKPTQADKNSFMLNTFYCKKVQRRKLKCFFKMFITFHSIIFSSVLLRNNCHTSKYIKFKAYGMMV